MNPALPFRLDDLLHTRTVESNRVEFKATWNDVIADSVVKTVCAFANDLLNLNGGYVVLGVEEAAGKAVLPPVGLGAMDLDVLQKKIRGACKSIDPDYQPTPFIEHVDGRPLVILWCNGGDNRPYKAPGKDQRQAFYVRQGSQTAEAQDDTLRQLLALTAKIPFDDRRYLPTASVRDISSTLVRRFLREVGSSLDDDNVSDADLYRQLQLVRPINAHEEPRNVALLFFNEHPEHFFRCASIEVARFRDDDGGDIWQEWKFEGPLPEQLRGCLGLLKSLVGEIVTKREDRDASERRPAIPLDAIREALVNAVYHRGYESSDVEPIKVYLYPDRLVIVSYPGPLPHICLEHLTGEVPLPPAPARNRRIGQLLKDLKLAESRGTGLAKIRRVLKQNGSPPPEFRFDRTYLELTLPMHCGHVMEQAQELVARKEIPEALTLLRRAFKRQPGLAELTWRLVSLEIQANHIAEALEVLRTFAGCREESQASLSPFLGTARMLTERGDNEQALLVLKTMPKVHMELPDRIEYARRLGDAGDRSEQARQLESLYHENPQDSIVVIELVEAKLERAEDFADEEREQLLCEVIEVLRSVCLPIDEPGPEDLLYFDAESNFASQCWLYLAFVSEDLKLPSAEIEAAYRQAIWRAPYDPPAKEAYAAWQARTTPRKPRLKASKPRLQASKPRPKT